jgi:hypothetical protein
MQAVPAPLVRWGLPAAAAAPWAAFTVAVTAAPVRLVAACFALRFAAALAGVCFRPLPPRLRLVLGALTSVVALVVALDASTGARLLAALASGAAATLCSSAVVDGYKDQTGPHGVLLTALARAAGALSGVVSPLAVLPAVALALAAATAPTPSCALGCRSCGPWTPRRAVTPPAVVLAAVLLVGTAPVLAHHVLAPELVVLAGALGALLAALVSHRGVLLSRRASKVRVSGVHARVAAPACAVAGLAVCAWSMPLPAYAHATAAVLAGAMLELSRYAVLAASHPGTVFARLFLSSSLLSSLAALGLLTLAGANAPLFAGVLTALIALGHLALTQTERVTPA